MGLSHTLSSTTGQEIPTRQIRFADGLTKRSSEGIEHHILTIIGSSFAIIVGPTVQKAGKTESMFSMRHPGLWTHEVLNQLTVGTAD